MVNLDFGRLQLIFTRSVILAVKDRLNCTSMVYGSSICRTLTLQRKALFLSVWAAIAITLRRPAVYSIIKVKKCLNYRIPQ